jgi:FAD/FMN-containing dehydrogenase
MTTDLNEILVQPGDETWDRSRQAWNLTVDQRPTAVAIPRNTDDVSEIVSWAQRRGLRIAAQGTGHGAAAHDALDSTVLVKTTRLDQIQIDPELCRARVGAGVVWSHVSAAAAEFGLAALAGSGPDVGVVGYTLGGGISWLARRYGLASNAVLAVEIVTADGRLVRTDRFHKPDLFWALRGGGGAFGVVTALEFELFPVPEVYAGTLFWPMEQAERVLNAWKAWADTAPPELTTCARLLNLPPLPDLPEHLRGRAFVAIEVAYAGQPSSAAEHLQPLRNLAPEIDTVTTMPAAELGRLHLDPDQPVPGKGNGGLLSALPAEAIAALVATAGAGTGSPLLSVEIRQLGGALADPDHDAGALAAIEAPYGIYSVGIAATPDLGRAIDARISAVAEALSRWQAPHSYLNFDDRAEATDALFPPDTYRRLRAVKAAYDPGDLFLSNHPIPPANPREV